MDVDAVTADAEDDNLTGKFLAFLVGKETYGIQIRYVTEIAGIQLITQMPEMPEFIKGSMTTEHAS
jgi:purine-binding chemotaxis protein CheW